MAKDLLRPIVHAVVGVSPDGMLTKAMKADMWSRLRHLRGLGFAPSQIVDIGAHDGRWTQAAAALFPEAQILMVEALEAKAERLDGLCRSLNGRAKAHIGLLDAEGGREVVFHEMETGSSMFKELSPAPGVSTQRVTSTLDAVMEAEAIARVDFLKLDVQGAELQVLKGARRALAQAEVVLLELAAGDYNAGAPGAAEVIGFMSQRGFLLRDLADVSRRGRGEPVMQFDAIFVSARSSLYRSPG